MAYKRKTRMYEPWGYMEEGNYNSTENAIESDFEAFLVGAAYNRDDNKIHFTNKDGEEKATIDVSEFIKSDLIVEKAWYDGGKIYIKFTNGDLITIDVKELIDEMEFADGLQVINGVVSIKLDPATERWLTVSQDGLKVSGIQAEIDRLDGRIDQEIADRIADVDAEEARAIGEETRIEAKLDQEIADRIADVDAEEARAIAEETRIEAKLDQEITRATRTEQALDYKINTLNAEIDAEERRAEAAEQEIRTLLTREVNDRIAAVNSETARAENAETTLQTSIEDEGRRAQDAETTIDNKIDEAISAFTTGFQQEAAERESADNALQALIETEVEDRKTDSIASAEYDEDSALIKFFNINDELIDTINVSKFIIDGMIDSVAIETTGSTTYLVIVWNTDTGKETTKIDIGDLFEADNYYTKAEIDDIIDDVDDDLAELDVKIDNAISSLTAAVAAEETRATGVEALKANAADVYTQEEVNALLLAKENEIYNLTKIVGDMGGAVTYELPNQAGKSFNTLMNNNGTVKLTDDVTTGRFGPGITAKNTVKLNLNSNDLTVTGLTTSSAQPAIMSRGTQNITIYGNGTVDAGGGVCIEANGVDSVINLTGSTTVYQNDRSGAELIYCYAGTINITNGTFKNLGENKGYMLNCYDSNYASGKAKIIVTGGKFYDFNPADNNAEGEHTSFVPEGYHVETSTDGDSTVYTVKKD